MRCRPDGAVRPLPENWCHGNSCYGCHVKTPIRTKCWAWTMVRRRLTSGRRICVWPRSTIPTRTRATKRQNGSSKRFRAPTRPCVEIRESARSDNRDRRLRSPIERNVTNAMEPSMTIDGNGLIERSIGAGGSSAKLRVNTRHVREQDPRVMSVAAPIPPSGGPCGGPSGTSTARTHSFGRRRWRGCWNGCPIGSECWSFCGWRWARLRWRGTSS